MWDLPPGPDPNEQVTMTRYYAAQRTFWVDPVSGTIVKETEHENHYFARDPLKPEVTLADYKVTSTEDTVESQVNAARDERDRLALWSRVLPITFTAVGLIALVGGGVLAAFSLRTESALTDPGLDRGDEEFFGPRGPAPRVPGAEAETEKLPAHRPGARQGSQRGPDAPDDPPDSGHRPAPNHPNGRNAPGPAVTEARVRALHWSQPAYALLLALLIVAPLLRPGYLLLRDAVSTPRSYLSDTALGLTSAPRATPQDFAVALASQLIDGGVVVKALLVLGLWLAGWGAARLVAVALPAAGVGGQFVATTLAIWNPYVAERLLQGHWSLLVGYGCLPWVASAMLTLRAGGAARWSALARPGLLDRVGGADADRADAGRDGGAGLRRRPGRGPGSVLAALALCRNSIGCRVGGRVALVDGVGGGLLADGPHCGERARG